MTGETVKSTVLGYTPEQLGDLFQTTGSWFKDKARRREIPFVMIGGQYRFTDEHIKEIVRIFEQRPEKEQPPKVVRRRTGVDAEPAGVATLQARRPQRARRSA